MNNKKIKCDVENCMYNNDTKECSLNEIKVSSNNLKKCNSIDQTKCISFKKGE